MFAESDFEHSLITRTESRQHKEWERYELKIENLDDLIDAIENTEINYGAMVIAYRALLAQLLAAGAFASIDAATLDKISGYVNMLPMRGEQMDTHAREQIRSELWQFANHHKNQPDVYHLARALICMFATEDSWELAQDPIIFYFYFYLSKSLVDTDARDVAHFIAHFVAHFKRELFDLG